MKQDVRIGSRVPTTMRIKLKYPDAATTIERDCSNLSRGGLFVATRNPRPVGSTVEFEFRLAPEDAPVRGAGEVVWVKAYDPDAPDETHGMGLRFTWLEPEGSKLVASVLGRPDGKRVVVGAPSEAEVTQVGKRSAQPPPAERTPAPRPSSPGPSPVAPVVARPRSRTAEMLAMAMADIADQTEPHLRLTPQPMPIVNEDAATVAQPRVDLDELGTDTTSVGPAPLAPRDELARLVDESGIDDRKIAKALARAKKLAGDDVK